MARLIINPLSNYEMVKTNETCAAGFLMSRFLLPESLIASARVVFLEAHGGHEAVPVHPGKFGQGRATPRSVPLLNLCPAAVFTLCETS